MKMKQMTQETEHNYRIIMIYTVFRDPHVTQSHLILSSSERVHHILIDEEYAAMQCRSSVAGWQQALVQSSHPTFFNNSGCYVDDSSICPFWRSLYSGLGQIQRIHCTVTAHSR